MRPHLNGYVAMRSAISAASMAGFAQPGAPRWRQPKSSRVTIAPMQEPLSAFFSALCVENMICWAVLFALPAIIAGMLLLVFALYFAPCGIEDEAGFRQGASLDASRRDIGG